MDLSGWTATFAWSMNPVRITFILRTSSWAQLAWGCHDTFHTIESGAVKPALVDSAISATSTMRDPMRNREALTWLAVSALVCSAAVAVITQAPTLAITGVNVRRGEWSHRAE